MRELVLNDNPTATKIRFVVRNHWVGLPELAASIVSVEDNSPVTPTIFEGHPMRNLIIVPRWGTFRENQLGAQGRQNKELTSVRNSVKLEGMNHRLLPNAGTPGTPPLGFPCCFLINISGCRKLSQF